MEPNTAVIPYQVMSQLEDHPDTSSALVFGGFYSHSEIIGAVLGIPNINCSWCCRWYRGMGTAGNAVVGSYLWGAKMFCSLGFPNVQVLRSLRSVMNLFGAMGVLQ